VVQKQRVVEMQIEAFQIETEEKSQIIEKRNDNHLKSPTVQPADSQTFMTCNGNLVVDVNFIKMTFTSHMKMTTL